MERLCRAYWRPVYAHARRSGLEAENACDATQEFFMRLIQGHWLRAADQDLGRFRTFLLTCLNRFLVSEWRKANAQKRGGQCEFFSLEEAREEECSGFEPVAGETPDRAFDRRWAETVLFRASARLRAEYETAGQSARYAALKVYLLEGHEPVSYADTAAQLGLSVGAVKSAIFTLRQRFGQTLRAELAETLSRGGDVEQELEHLLDALGD